MINLIMTGGDDMVHFGQRLKELRLQAGLTQKQLADRIWVSKAAIGNYELSDRKPSPEIIVKLAKVFHVSTDYLLGIDEKEHIIDVSGLSDDEIAAVQNLVDIIKKNKDFGD